MSLFLHGYRYSVYVRIVRLVLAEKGAAYERVEVNPFAADVPAEYLRLHPFGRVPALVHDGFALYETGAITRYVDRAFPGPALQPEDPKRLARMDQIMGVVDAYAYWPLVRQVFVHDVVRPHMGTAGDAAELEKGLAASAKVLDALETLAAADSWLTGPDISLADFHLGAMVAYFAQSPRGTQLLTAQPRLSTWWQRFKARPSVVATDPGLPVTQA
ncbi:MAG: glutathione S-transferase family protein [Reyranella sp.]|uniref:glutathione S-transferase family protein n=1 Tax=Reyranella sp. TaxID=1929291 RepID=UPI0012232B99|nr:glutathione S-transferase family protein [Reyranella sp.]TAJ86367.1 MAG: glutathione S-transferase family protein [Reyranella sp.]TBR28469.1 MAG: glutathione S-transferase family protein [Reyranella sp.]